MKFQFQLDPKETKALAKTTRFIAKLTRDRDEAVFHAEQAEAQNRQTLISTLVGIASSLVPVLVQARKSAQDREDRFPDDKMPEPSVTDPNESTTSARSTWDRVDRVDYTQNGAPPAAYAPQAEPTAAAEVVAAEKAQYSRVMQTMTEIQTFIQSPLTPAVIEMIVEPPSKYGRAAHDLGHVVVRYRQEMMDEQAKRHVPPLIQELRVEIPTIDRLGLAHSIFWSFMDDMIRAKPIAEEKEYGANAELTKQIARDQHNITTWVVFGCCGNMQFACLEYLRAHPVSAREYAELLKLESSSLEDIAKALASNILVASNQDAYGLLMFDDMTDRISKSKVARDFMELIKDLRTPTEEEVASGHHRSWLNPHPHRLTLE